MLDIRSFSVAIFYVLLLLNLSHETNGKISLLFIAGQHIQMFLCFYHNQEKKMEVQGNHSKTNEGFIQIA